MAWSGTRCSSLPTRSVFVFEGADPHAVLAALTGDNEQSVLGAWESLVDGTPKIAREVYSWISPA